MEDTDREIENMSLSLAGIWEFKEYPVSARKMQDLKGGQWHQTTRCGSIYSALLQSGQITEEDLYTNPENLAWVSKRPWIFKKTFSLAQEAVECRKTELLFEGLDTIASIWLNGKLIGKTNNMFIPFRFDVTRYVKTNGNVLLVKFEPAEESAGKIKKNCKSLRRSRGGETLAAYIRKAKFQFGADFCPPLPGCGICGQVKVLSTKKTRIADVHIRTIESNADYADIKIKVQLDAKYNADLTCKLTISDNALILDHEIIFKPGERSHSALIRIDKPQLWWPRGYGNQNLYKLEIKLLSEDCLVDRNEKTFGIRSIKLDRSGDEYGEKFQFVVNSEPIYITGANWLPMSMLPGSAKTKHYEKLLTAAVEANINMLRVCAGGGYESDEFYKLCDRLGILVWQDFMFCADRYPHNDWFVDQIKKEAAVVIRRIRSHASLAVWCGNDEIDLRYAAGEFGKGAKYKSRRIFQKILPQIVADFDSDGNYISTTPGGKKTDLNNPDSGTVKSEFWQSQKSLGDLAVSEKKIPRFVTEFGLPSLPCLQTVESFCKGRDKRIGSRVIEAHNYQFDSNSKIYRYLGDNFGTARDVDELIYLSQITQGRAAKTFVEHLRANRARNAGVLLWHFNEPYPATTSSMIDFGQTPKAIYYYAKRFYRPLMIAVLPNYKIVGGPLRRELQSGQCVVVNDSRSPVTATLHFKLSELSGKILDESNLPISLAPNSVSPAVNFPRDLLTPKNPSQVCLLISLEKDGLAVAENMFFYLPDKYIDWPKAKIQSSVIGVSETQFEVTLSADSIVRDVEIIAPQAAYLSDNFVNLTGDKQTQLTVTYSRQQLDRQPEITFRSINSIFV